MEGLGRHRPVLLGHKDVRGRPLFALQTPQRAYLIALHRVDTRRAVLRPPPVGWQLAHRGPTVELMVTCSPVAFNDIKRLARSMPADGLEAQDVVPPRRGCFFS